MAIDWLNQGIWMSLCLYALSSTISIAAANVAMSLAGLLAIIRCIKEPVKMKLDKGLLIVISVFFLSLLVSLIPSAEPWEGIQLILNYLYRLFPLFLVVHFIEDKKKIAALVFIMGASILISDSYAIWQWLHGNPRARAFGPTAMSLAGYLVQLIPLYFMLLHGKSKKWEWRIYFFILGMSMITLIFNGTRGAWVAIAGTFCLYLALHLQKQKKVAAVGVVLFLLIGLIFIQVPNLHNRVLSILDTSHPLNVERMLLWHSAAQMFLDHPVTGVGLDQFEEVYLSRYISPLAVERLGHAHNNFLQMLAETGVVGFLAFLSLFGYILYDSWQKYQKQGYIWGGIIFFVTISLLIQGFTEFNFGNSAVIRMYWFILGISYYHIYGEG